MLSSWQLIYENWITTTTTTTTAAAAAVGTKTLLPSAHLFYAKNTWLTEKLNTVAIFVITTSYAIRTRVGCHMRTAGGS